MLYPKLIMLHDDNPSMGGESKREFQTNQGYTQRPCLKEIKDEDKKEKDMKEEEKRGGRAGMKEQNYN